MNFELLNIYNRGDLQNERLHLRVKADVDLTYCLVFDSIYIGPTEIGNGQRTGFWFPPKIVKAGNNVVLYTRAGNASEELRPNGEYFHFIFRGLTIPKYGHPHSCAVVIEMLTWDTTKPATPISKVPSR